MKKIGIVVVALTLVMACAVPALAANDIPKTALRPFVGASLTTGEMMVGVAYEMSLVRGHYNGLSVSLDAGLCGTGSLKEFNLVNTGAGGTGSLQFFREGKNIGIRIGYAARHEWIFGVNPIVVKW